MLMTNLEVQICSSRRQRHSGLCPCCDRHMALTFHHLIPRKMHRRPRFRRRYNKAILNQGIYICRDCHKGVHAAYDEMELAMRLNSPEALMSDTLLQRHFRWVSRQRRAGIDS